MPSVLVIVVAAENNTRLMRRDGKLYSRFRTMLERAYEMNSGFKQTLLHFRDFGRLCTTVLHVIRPVTADITTVLPTTSLCHNQIICLLYGSHCCVSFV